MAKGLDNMPITVAVKPDLEKYFRTATAEEVAIAASCDLPTAQRLIANFVVMPR